METICANKDKTLKYIIGFLVLIITVITFSPLLNFGFVMGDDVEFFYNSNVKFWHSISKTYAQGTGRFYFLLVDWIYFLPYQIDAPWFYHLMRILPVIVSLILFVWLIKRATKNDYVWMLALLVFCACFQINGDASAVTSYPFYFSFASVLILTSFHLLFNYFDGRRYWNLILSAIVFAFASCFHESLLLYYIAFFLLIVYRYNIKTIFQRDNLHKFLKELAPYIILGVIYLTAYFLYSAAHPSKYSGNQLASQFSLMTSLNILNSLVLHTLPLSAFFEYRTFLVDYSSSVHTDYSLWFFLRDASSVSYIKAVLLAAVLYIIIERSNINGKMKKPVWMFILSIFLIILPHIALTLSNKSYSTVPIYYVSTFFSYFGVVLLLLSIVLFCVNLSDKPVVKKVLSACFAVSLGVVSLFIQYANERVAYDNKISNDRFRVLDDFFDSADIQAYDVLYLKDFDNNPTYGGKGLTYQKSASVKAYLVAKHGVELKGYKDYDELYTAYSGSTKAIKILFFSQAAKSEDAIISIVKCNGNNLPEHLEDLRTDSIFVGYYSAYKNFAVSISSDTLSPLAINNIVMSSVGSSHFANIKSYKHDVKTLFTIKGCDMAPKTLTVSNVLYKDVAVIGIGRYPRRYDSVNCKSWKRTIKRDAGWTRHVEELSEKRGETFEESLTNTARWMTYTTTR
ncbi:MAG: hypothetical protein PHR20_01505 [Bacteroidales bacterium]|nr:hypothetical protein [Bacteroidales bacterium]